jgi:hypothetical protein
MRGLLPEISEGASRLHRVADNINGLALREPATATSALAGPLHFRTMDLSARRGSAQTISATFHATVFCIALVLFTAVRDGHSPLHPIGLNPHSGPLKYPRPAEILPLDRLR